MTATCSVNYTTPTQAATLCDCNMLSQLCHTNSGSNTLWLQHAQPTMPHQLRQQHSVTATCSANYATPTQAATLWLQHAQPTIPHQLRQQHSVAATCSTNYIFHTNSRSNTMIGQLCYTNSGSNTLWLQHANIPTLSITAQDTNTQFNSFGSTPFQAVQKEDCVGGCCGLGEGGI